MYALSRQSVIRWVLASAALWCLALGSARAQDPYVLYIDGFPARNMYIAPLRGLTQDAPPQISPRAVRLPQPMGTFGNPDVSHDGKRIVFPTLMNDEWNIYEGNLDPARRRISSVRPLVAEPGMREEDPRYSWDGRNVVYKCGFDICLLHPGELGLVNPVVEGRGCELYGPAFHPSGTTISYTARCGSPDDDRIRISDLGPGQPRMIEVPKTSGTPDRFSHFLNDGRLLYSHEDSNSGTASLWIYDPGKHSASLFHNRTVSDDDPYVHKSDPEYVAFSGYRRGYNLFIYRFSRKDSVQLSSRTTVLGPVIFNVGPGY